MTHRTNYAWYKVMAQCRKCRALELRQITGKDKCFCAKIELSKGVIPICKVHNYRAINNLGSCPKELLNIMFDAEGNRIYYDP